LASRGGLLETERTLGAVIVPGRCWGSNVSEDTGLGACQLCVDLCPEVFEKPIVNFTAFVRPDADLAPYEDEIRQVALSCPVEAIEVTQPALNRPPGASS
jgi:ferredoxin